MIKLTVKMIYVYKGIHTTMGNCMRKPSASASPSLLPSPPPYPYIQMSKTSDLGPREITPADQVFTRDVLLIVDYRGAHHEFTVHSVQELNDCFKQFHTCCGGAIVDVGMTINKKNFDWSCREGCMPNNVFKAINANPDYVMKFRYF